MRLTAWNALMYFVLASVGASGSTFCTLASSGQPTTRPVPLWHTDLRQYGYDEKKSWREGMNHVYAAFTSDRVLTLAYHIGLEHTLHAIFFEALTGERRAVQSWSEASDFLPTHNGSFLVRNSGGLALYSPGFEQLRQLLVDCSHQRYGNWCYDVWVSPSGSMIFINQGTMSTFTLRKLDADTLTQLGSWNSQRRFLAEFKGDRDSIADEKIVSTGNDFHPKALYITDIDRRWPSVRDSPSVLVADLNWHEIYHVKRGLVGSPTFIADNLIALCGERSIVLLKADGSILFEDHTVRWPDYLVGKVVPSSVGRRLAVRVASGRPDFSDFPQHRFIGVVVYDVRQQKVVLRVDHKATLSDSIALSPDGSILAVQHGSSLDVFRVPE